MVSLLFGSAERERCPCAEGEVVLEVHYDVLREFSFHLAGSLGTLLDVVTLGKLAEVGESAFRAIHHDALLLKVEIDECALLLVVVE